MNDFLRDAVQQRRNNIINILLALEVYSHENELLELSITELEKEFQKISEERGPFNGDERLGNP